MEFVTLIVVALLVLIALLLMAFPLWRQTRPEALFQVNPGDQTIEEFEARYQAVLAAIKDLMFDYEMGKVDEADYEILLNKAKSEAASIRQAIDRLSTTSETMSRELDHEIEALIVQTRRTVPANDSALLRRVDTEISLLKDVHLDEEEDDGGATEADSSRTCAECGAFVRPGDLFCGTCGTPVQPRNANQTNFCSNCGHKVTPADTFCVRCGDQLHTVIEVEP
jgi:hypothetical protein